MSGRSTVVIVNYNGGDSLLRCLAALNAQTIEHELIVVDNASIDGSARRAFDAFPATRVIPLRHNTGFARGFNIGVSRMSRDRDIVVALNPDTVPEAHFLEHLLTPLADRPDVGSVAGSLTFASSPDRIASAGITMHRNGVAIDSRLGQQLDRAAAPCDVFGASGGAAAYRVAAFRSVGGFFEPFFMYLEDVDLAWRLRWNGWQSIWSPGAVATHEYSASAGEGSGFKHRLLARNRIWTLARCLPEPLWRRNQRSIFAFDLLAMAHGALTRDGAALRGRAEGVLALPLRLAEGTTIRRSSSVPWEDIDRVIASAIGPGDVLRLRRLTRKLAAKP